MSDYSQNINLPRGLRDNNPLNIEPVGFTYNGQIGLDSNGEAIFSDTLFGFRAAALDLYTAYFVHSRKSLTDIINVFAPSFENDTAGYIQYVANDMGISPDVDINLNGNVMLQLIRSMMKIELGESYAAYFTDDEIKAGIVAAGKTELMFAAVGSGVILLLISFLIYMASNKKSNRNV